MQFNEALSYLSSLGHETLAIKLGLENTQLLLRTLDNPEKSYTKVQIAGTNGKGSACVVLASICRAAGIRTGLFTSPHLISITERVIIDDQEISEAEFGRHAGLVMKAVDDLLEEGLLKARPTYFEHVTAIALLAFRSANVELAILETGLGGRLDATTAAQAELVGITAIQLDHTEILGDTVEAIADEKAAIIRPGVKAVVAPQVPEVISRILAQCRQVGVQTTIGDWQTTITDYSPTGHPVATFNTAEDQYEEVTIGLRGRHQLNNVGLAVRLAQLLRARGFPITRASIIDGIERASHPGRLELLEGSPRFLFDGAHNVSGATVLRAYLDQFVSGPLSLVFGVMRNKNIQEIGKILFPKADVLILSRPDNPRAADLEKVREIARNIVGNDTLKLALTAAAAIDTAVAFTPPVGTICVTGSLYFIGEFKEKLMNSTVPIAEGK